MAAPALNRATRWTDVSNFGRVYERKRDGKVYIDCKPYGRIYSVHGAPFESRAHAQSILDSIRLVISQGTPKRVAVERWLPKSSASHRVDRWLKLWLKHLEDLERAKDRSEGYLNEIRRWTGEGDKAYLRTRWGSMSIHAITRPEIQAWSLELHEAGLSSKTRWNVLAALSAFLRWLVESEALASSPRFPWPPVQEYTPKIISPADRTRIINTIPEDARGIFLALGLLGLRPSEGRRADAADYEPGEVPWLSIRRTKNRKAKRLPVPEELAEWIEVHVPREARLKGRPLFAMPWHGRGKAKVENRRWSKTGMRRAWTKACGAAGVDVGLYEGTKHSRATQLLAEGISERVLQEILGHKDARSTRKYARIADQAVVYALRGGSKAAPTNPEGK
jgi:integrase